MSRTSKSLFINVSNVDFLLLITVMVLVVFGLSLIYSASSYKAEKKYGDSSYFLQKHVVRVLIALLVMIFVAVIDYHFWIKISPFALLLAFLLLMFLFSGSHYVEQVKGARRWISFGPARFQPSDFARYALIIALSKSLTQNRENLQDFVKGFLPYLTILTSVCVLIYLEPDLSTSIIVTMIGFSMLFVAGANVGHILAACTTLVTVALFLVTTFGYQMQRLMDFLNRIFNDGQLSWQAKQSLVSLAQGGLWGQGLGAGRQKYDFLPEPHKDFIFSILGEELGIIGTIGVLVLFLVLFWLKQKNDY